MKKIYILGLIALMCSCQNSLREEVATDVPFSSAVKFVYNGHSYIKFKSGAGDCSVCGVVHDPDCQCFQEPSDAEYEMGYEDGQKDKEDK